MRKRLSYGLVGGLFLFSGCTNEGRPTPTSAPTGEAIAPGIIINTQIDGLDLSIFSKPELKDNALKTGTFRFGQAAVALCLHTPKLDDKLDRELNSMVKIHDYDGQEGYVGVYQIDENQGQTSNPHFQLDYNGFKSRIPDCDILPSLKGVKSD